MRIGLTLPNRAISFGVVTAEDLLQMAEIADQGLSVRAMFHPIVNVHRDEHGDRASSGVPRRESMIQVILDPIGADRETALLEGVGAALSDAHAAVADFPTMLQLLDRTLAELRERPGPSRTRTEET